MISRPLGKTGIDVSALGLGCGALGESRIDDDAAQALVARALDLGVTVFDTAPSYGDSETKLGRALRGRREDAVVVTKGGYGVEGALDWTRDCIVRGVDRALARLAIDCIDVFLLHSCPLEVLARGDLLGALSDAKNAGKLRAIGYSGDNEALAWASRNPLVDVIEASVNPFDRSACEWIDVACARGAGVIAKRPLGNAPWRFDVRPAREDIAVYWDRHREMRFDETGDPFDVALRFSVFTHGVASALLGTADIDYLEHACASVGRGPLSSHEIEQATKGYRSSWRAVI